MEIFPMQFNHSGPKKARKADILNLLPCNRCLTKFRVTVSFPGSLRGHFKNGRDPKDPMTNPLSQESKSLNWAFKQWTQSPDIYLCYLKTANQELSVAGLPELPSPTTHTHTHPCWSRRRCQHLSGSLASMVPAGSHAQWGAGAPCQDVGRGCCWFQGGFKSFTLNTVECSAHV